MLSDKAREVKAEYHRQNRKKRRDNRTPEQIDKEREYQKEWKRKNPDKVKVSDDLYWERRALKRLGSNGNDCELDTTFFGSTDSFKTKVETKISDEVIHLNDKELERIVIKLHKNNISLRVTATVLGISHMRVSRILARQRSAQ